MATAGVSVRKRSKDSSKAHAFNQSRVKLYLRCRKAYWFRYDSHGKPGTELVPKHNALPLKRGSWMHALQEAHWLESLGKSKGWEVAHKKLTREFDKLFDEEKERYGDLPGECSRRFASYLRFYQDEDQKFRVAMLPDGTPGIEFVVSVSLDRWGIGSPFKGRIDILVEDLEYGGYWIRDAKWVKSIPSPDERMMSPQNALYVWAVRRALGLDVRGFIYDYGRTKAPTIPLTPTGKLSLAKKFDTDTRTFLQAAVKVYGKAKVREMMQDEDSKFFMRLKEVRANEATWFRRERIPVPLHVQKQALREFVATIREIQRRKTGENSVPRTYLYSCKWNCAYHDPCVAQYTGLDYEALLKRNYILEQESYAPEENDLVG